MNTPHRLIASLRYLAAVLRLEGVVRHQEIVGLRVPQCALPLRTQPTPTNSDAIACSLGVAEASGADSFAGGALVGGKVQDASFPLKPECSPNISAHGLRRANRLRRVTAWLFVLPRLGEQERNIMRAKCCLWLSDSVISTMLYGSVGLRYILGLGTHVVYEVL